MSLLQMSISGAIMILAVIVIRALAINRLPKKTFIALWAIVLLRLLVPFSIPFPFSAYSIVDNHISIVQGTTIFENENIFPVSLPTIGERMQELTSLNISPYMIVWGIGMAACVLFFTISYFKCHKEFRESLPIKNDFIINWIAEHKLTRPIKIRQSSRISTPLTYGIFKPIILMPKNTKWEDIKQIEYILTHEFVHIRQFDVAIKLLLAAVLCIHWFNPLVWVMYIIFNRDIELSCDESVVRSFGDNSKSAYARALINMEEKKSTLAPLCNNFSKNAIEERITAIMKMKKKSIGVSVLAIIVVLGITAIFATSTLASNDNASKIQTEQQNAASADKQAEGLVTYDIVEVRHYTDGGAPYVFWSRTNNTEKTITNIQFTMLAFDDYGKPLNLPWNVMDSSAGYSYDVLCEWQPVDLKPQATADSNDGSEEGGWSLGWSIPNDDDKELQKLFSKVAYILCYDKQITFEDGKVWNNPNYDKWLETYLGNEVDVTTLKNYYVK